MAHTDTDPGPDRRRVHPHPEKTMDGHPSYDRPGKPP